MFPVFLIFYPLHFHLTCFCKDRNQRKWNNNEKGLIRHVLSSLYTCLFATNWRNCGQCATSSASSSNYLMNVILLIYNTVHKHCNIQVYLMLYMCICVCIFFLINVCFSTYNPLHKMNSMVTSSYICVASCSI